MKMSINSFLFLSILMMLVSCGPDGSIKPDAQVSISSEQSIVMMATRGETGKYSVEPMLTFLPFDLEKGELLGRKTIQKPFAVGRKQPMFGASHHDVWAYHAVTVEPGAYILHSTRNQMSNETTTYTLGSVAFEIKPGETKYIGEYQYGLPNRQEMTIGEVGKNALKAFFTLGLAGMPDPQIISIDASQSEKHMLEAKKSYPNIKSEVSMSELNPEIKFASGRVNLIYKVRMVDKTHSESVE